jgi:hypothetical protein
MLHFNLKASLIVIFFTTGGSFNLQAQCYKDIDCKGNRICVNGICVNPDTNSTNNITSLPDSCYNDMNCKGNMVCENGHCVEQPQTHQPEMTPAPNQEVSMPPAKNTTISNSLQPLKSNQQIKLALIGKFGINIANIRGKTVIELDDENGFDFNPKPGVIAGGALFVAIHKYFALEPEFLFSMRGSKFSYYSDDGRIEGKEVFNFLEIPINAKLTFPTNSPLTPNIFIAPVVSFRVAAKNIDIKSATNIYDDEDVMDNTRGAEFGLAFGGGTNLEINNTLLTFCTRLLFGLTDINDNKLQEGYKTWALSFILGTGIKLK